MPDGYTSSMPWDALEPLPSDPTVKRGLVMLGAAVRRRREALNLSQRDLSRRSGVSQSAISRFENGLQFCIRWSRFARIVVALGGLDFNLHERPDQPKPKSLAQLRAESMAEWYAESAAIRERQRLEQEEEDRLEAEEERLAAEEARILRRDSFVTRV